MAGRIDPKVDIVMDVLKAVQAKQPDSVFVNSLLFQYQERGSLSRSQLEGLYGKASKISELPAAKLATLEAIIKKKPVRHRAPLPVVNADLPAKDVAFENKLLDILLIYPEHKRILFLKARLDGNEAITPKEKEEAEKLHALLMKKAGK